MKKRSQLIEDENADMMDTEEDTMDTLDVFANSEIPVVSNKETMDEVEVDPTDTVEYWKEKYEEEAKKNGYLVADFQNFKRRTQLDTERAINANIEEVIRNFISLSDDFDRGLKVNPEDPVLKMLEMNFRNILKRYDVTPIDSSNKFDFNKHMAVAVREADWVEPDTILETCRKGYMIKDKVLRFADVIVSK